jgi:Ni/Co efflux regulator RcnB
MNTLMKAIVLSISTALVATPAMAAPQDNQKHQPQTVHNQKAPTQHQVQKDKAQPKAQQHKNSVKPAHDWRAGQKVPSQYRGNSYKVDHSKYKKLSKPAKNQQWIKVNGDYVLTNVISHSIIKVIAG